ncbi:ComEC/Rec2 family competence protein [Pseudarthrobacter sp. J1738]|uniref:ComEC/Rec2 family competence protein n=1 Tax=Pseudarthrobacter sp. J1738 TaxID=3420446 RepID=UPI003D2E450B
MERPVLRRDAEGRIVPRTDLRLVPVAAMVWLGTLAGLEVAAVWLLTLAAVLGAGVAVLLFSFNASTSPGSTIRRHNRLQRLPYQALSARVSGRALVALAVLMGAVALGVSASNKILAAPIAVSQDSGGASGIVATLQIDAPPKALASFGQGDAQQWKVAATIVGVNDSQVQTPCRMTVVLTGSGAWSDVVPGQKVRAAGALLPPQNLFGAPRLQARANPRILSEPPWYHAVAQNLRAAFLTQAKARSPDRGALVPGLVIGNTSMTPEELTAAMKTTGTTHLTAVSGANCSLILGAILLGARSLKLRRRMASMVAGLGLLGFVFVVGPDPSVLRAAVMGAIGLVSLLAGRRGQSLGFVCLAVVGLLLTTPTLAADFGFILSVLATLGIVLCGSVLAKWLERYVPTWCAAAMGITVGAQLFCAPVLILLQPQVTTYSLPANLVAGLLVAPVTFLGTAALALCTLVPEISGILLVPTGWCAQGIAAVATFFAHLPGAALPWPEGGFGLATMAALSALWYLALWCAFHPVQCGKAVELVHRKIVEVGL